MENNNYSPPKSNINTKTEFKGSPLKAVIVATSIDIIGSMTFGVIYAFIYAIVLSSEGVPPEQIEKAITNIDTYSIHSIIGTIIGLSISLCAGYICARTVNYKEYKVVTVYAVIILTFSLFIGASKYSLIEYIILNSLSLMFIYSGAWLYVKNKP